MAERARLPFRCLPMMVRHVGVPARGYKAVPRRWAAQLLPSIPADSYRFAGTAATSIPVTSALPSRTLTRLASHRWSKIRPRLFPRITTWNVPSSSSNRNRMPSDGFSASRPVIAPSSTASRSPAYCGLSARRSTTDLYEAHE